MKLRRVAVAVVGLLAGCGAPAPPPVVPAPGPSASASAAPVASSVPPPDDPVPLLRTGAIAPVDVPGVRELTLVSRHAAHGFESLEVALPQDLSYEGASVALDAAPGAPSPLSFLAQDRGERRLWLRRAESTSDATGDLYTEARRDTPGKHYRFRVASPAAHKSEPRALPAYLRGLADQFESWRSSAGPWSATAAARLRRMAEALDVDPKRSKGKAPKARVRLRPNPVRQGDLTGFFETTTGLTAVQEALQSDRALAWAAADHQATVPVGTLELPPLKHHPWKDMRARLAAPPAEPLAADVPAEFYYLRASGLTPLLSLLDELDSWVTAGGEVLREAAQDRDLAGRYEAQLGLRRGPLTRALGPAVVSEVAVTGSDPYLDEGSDLTVVFRVKQPSLFDAALAATQADLEKEHGALAHETRDHGGVQVQVSRSPDGVVRQQRATVGDLALVSNSPGALDAVLDAVAGKRARLADEQDFQYMLARDAQEAADVLAFLGDRFVASVVGPRQKILERRRLDALSDLVQPGAAALLYGLVQGKSPAKVDDLFAAGLLSPDDLVHADGQAIAWQPGQAPRSAWGTPASLTPLVDLPQVDKVTPEEKSAYESFARGYQYNWSAYIDPVAVRFTLGAPGADGTQRIGASLRELPLIENTKYGDIADFVGAARFVARPSRTGVRLVAGLAHDSDTRRDVTHLLRDLSGNKIGLDWVGDWVAVGLADRAALADVLLRLDDDVPQKPDERVHRGELTELARLPVYAEISIKSQAAAALVLAAARVMADTTIPGMFDWGESEKYRGISIVHVALKGDAAKELVGERKGVDLYYAVAKGALVLTLQDWLMRTLLDERLDGAGPDGAPAGDKSGDQLELDLASAPGNGLWSTLAWELEEQMIEAGTQGSRAEAEGLLRGAPELASDPTALRALALAYFGAAPVTPDGASYGLARDGVRDPARGTPFAPAWPALPVVNSPVDRILRALAAVHTQVSLDDEGKDGDRTLRSLHARATFTVKH